jgi:hypothetical protein
MPYIYKAPEACFLSTSLKLASAVDWLTRFADEDSVLGVRKEGEDG